MSTLFVAMWLESYAHALSSMLHPCKKFGLDRAAECILAKEDALIVELMLKSR